MQVIKKYMHNQMVNLPSRQFIIGCRFLLLLQLLSWQLLKLIVFNVQPSNEFSVPLHLLFILTYRVFEKGRHGLVTVPPVDITMLHD